MKTKSSMESKSCQWCFRPFEWRKKWELVWDQVKFCSDSCKKESKIKKNILEHLAIEDQILKLTLERKPKSLCPSEIARNLFENWQPKMETVRQVCRKLHLEQKILITQQDMPIKEINFKGPIRIKLIT